MKKLLLLLCISTVVLVHFSCKKDDNSGPPSINTVRAVDSTKRDSFFVKAVPGNLIVIQGVNLGGLKAVYFNDTSAYFNPAYATSSNIIVTIPASAQTAATNPKVPSIIKVVTDHGTATYAFTLYLPPPAISSIAIDNSGKILYINGYNFQGIQKIRFPVAGADTALSFTVNKTFTQIAAVIPPGVPFKDSLRVYCTFGTAAFSYPPPMSITSVSNENAAGGNSITINGTNFIGIQQVVFPGGINSTSVQTNSVNQLTVLVPMGITTTDSIRLIGSLGTIATPQLFDSYITHVSPGYLTTFQVQYSIDNTGFIGWTGGYADAPTAATNYPGGTNGVGVLQQQSPMPGNSSAGSQGNGGLMQLNGVPWVANTGESINNYSMKFEVYVAKPWSAGAIWISVGNWYGWKSYTARYAPWLSATGGIYQPAGWVTATIPLSQFITKNEFYQTSWNSAGVPAVTFKDYPFTDVGFLIVNDQAKPNMAANTLSIAVDNVRIVKGQ